MATELPYPVDKGCVDGIDPSLLEPGKLQESVGVVYAPGDPAAHKHGGRSLFNSTTIASAAVNGLQFVDFDSAADRVLAQVNGALYSADSTVGTFSSIRTGLSTTVTHLESAKVNDELHCCNGTDTNWVVKSDNTTIRQGLLAQTVAPTHTSAGTGITGTFIYWCTEYDQTNDVESATVATGATLSVTVTDDTVTITKPATLNTSATHWRLYRSKDLGAFPIGWLVATVAIATTTYADSTADAALVLLTPYPLVTVNGLSKGQNFPGPVFRSLASFEGSLVGVADRSIYWSETGLPHYFPQDYRILFKPPFGGLARCCRRIWDKLLVFLDHDAYIVNYLPKQADSGFDSGVADYWLAHHGTPSPAGACVFTGWGGAPMCIVATRLGPMLTDGERFDKAVKSINWSGIVSLANLGNCVLIDNPDMLRVEMYAQSAASQSSWICLHFYYDSLRVRQEQGIFPELVWTGPHPVPGPGAFGVVSGTGQVFTGARSASGFTYKESVGTSDAANLTDSSGTVPFHLRTGRIYPQGIDGTATLERVFIHKKSAGSGTYTTTVNAFNEGDAGGGATPTRSISAAYQGSSSDMFKVGGQSFDVRVVRDDAIAMPPINGITLTFEDLEQDIVKTSRR